MLSVNKKHTKVWFAITVFHLFINSAVLTRIPLELLPYCDGPQETSSELLNFISGLSAIKRGGNNVYSSNNKLFPRFADPFPAETPLPWSCEIAPLWRDLGDDYIPRFVRDGTCVNRTCWYRHYDCRPVMYNVPILQKQDNECFDQSLPRSLATKWRQRSLAITSSCICQRP